MNSFRIFVSSLVALTLLPTVAGHGADVVSKTIPLKHSTATPEGTPLRDALLREAAQPSKPTWQPMLRYLAELHGQSVFPAVAHLRHPYNNLMD